MTWSRARSRQVLGCLRSLIAIAARLPLTAASFIGRYPPEPRGLCGPHGHTGEPAQSRRASSVRQCWRFGSYAEPTTYGFAAAVCSRKRDEHRLVAHQRRRAVLL